MLDKLSFWKALRVMAWIARFIRNCRVVKKQRITGPLTTVETNKQLNFWIKRAQQDSKETDSFKEDLQRLNLQQNDQQIYECRGRIQGHYPVYLPSKHNVSEKIIEDAHLQTLHGE